MYGYFLGACPSAARIMLESIPKMGSFQACFAGSARLYSMHNQFYPLPLRKSGNQGTFRIVQQVHRRKLRSIFKIRTTLRKTERVCSSAGICLFFTNELHARRLPMAICLAVLIFNQCRFVLRTSKEVFNDINKNARARACWIAWSSPQPRNTRVASDQALQVLWALWPMTVSCKRTCQPGLSGRSETLTRKREHYEKSELPTETTLPPVPGRQLCHASQS